MRRQPPPATVTAAGSRAEPPHRRSRPPSQTNGTRDRAAPKSSMFRISRGATRPAGALSTSDRHRGQPPERNPPPLTLAPSSCIANLVTHPVGFKCVHYQTRSLKRPHAPRRKWLERINFMPLYPIFHRFGNTGGYFPPVKIPALHRIPARWVWVRPLAADTNSSMSHCSSWCQRHIKC